MVRCAADDGVDVNVAAFARLLEEGVDSVRPVTDEEAAEEAVGASTSLGRTSMSDGT